MKHFNFVSPLLSLLFAFILGVSGAFAQCPPAPAGCLGCGTKNPTFIVSTGNETCVGLSDGSLEFLNLLNTDGMSYPLTWEWYTGNDCSGAILSTGVLASGFPTSAGATILNLADGAVFTLVVYDGTFYSYQTFTVDIIDIPPNVPVINPTSATLCPGSSEVLTAVEGGGGEAWDTTDSLRWYVDGVLSAGPNSALNNPTFTIGAPGDVYVTIDNGSGCINTSDTITVTEVALTITETIVDLLCEGATTGSINLNVSGGDTPYSYLWSPGGATTSNISGLGAGNYNVTVTENNGCDTVLTYTVDEPVALSVIFTVTPPLCANPQCDGTVSAVVNGGTGAYTYLWGGGSITATQGSVCGGNLTFNVLDGNSCPLDSTLAITAPDAITIVTAKTDQGCSGANDGDASATPAGGTAPYTYGWSNGFNETNVATSTASSLAPGTYTVTVTDVNGCFETATVTIDPAVPLVCSETHIDPTCNGLNTGSIDLTVTGGTTMYTFDWSTGAVTEDIGSLGDGVYTVTVTDAQSCTCTSSVTLTAPTAVTATLTAVDPGCSNTSDGTINSNVSGGTTPYTYLWAPGGQTSPNITGLGAGNYTVTVTDNNACTGTATTTLTPPSAVVVDTATTAETCFNAGDGTATASASGGAGNYTFNWSTGASQTGFATSTISSLDDGTYTVTVTDGNGCTEDTTLIVSGPLGLNITVTPVNLDCFGDNDGSITIATTGGILPHTYTWLPNVSATNAATNLTAGTYAITVADNNGCDTSFTQDITQPAAYNLTIGSTDPLCGDVNDGDATVTVNSGGTIPYTFDWNTGFSESGVTTSSRAGLAGGAYDVTITDNAGCDSIVTFGITQPTPLNVDTINVVTASCVGLCDGSAEAVVTGGSTPVITSWEHPITNAPLGAGTTIPNLCAGDQLWAISVDANLCADTTVAFAIDTNVIIGIVLTPTDETCLNDGDGTISVTENGGTSPYTYTWSNGQTTDPAVGLVSGTYIVTVEDAGGCSAIDSAVIVPGVLITLTNDTTDATCFGNADGEAGVTAAGGTTPYTYLWDAAAGNQTNATATGLGAGAYCVTVTDNGGCTATTCITIDQPADFTITSAGSALQCFGDADGTASVTVSGGATPYTYLWTSGGTTSNESGLIADDYTVTITDNNACSSTVTVTVTEPTELITSQNGQTNNTCFGTSIGTATVGATGGTVAGAYGYVWSSGGTAATETGLAAGDYTVTVTDDNNCPSTETFTIIEGIEIQFTSGSTDETCNGVQDGSAGVNVTQGTGPFDYTWSNGAAANDTAFFLQAGTYTITIMDANLCDTTQTFVINGTPAYAVTPSTTGEGCVGQNNGTATVAVTGGTTPYTYLWDAAAGNQTTATATGLPAGDYDVTVADANACDTSLTLTVAPGVDIDVTITTNDNVCGFIFPACVGSVSAAVTGGSTPYTYLWDTFGGPGTATVNNVCGGAYNVTVTDAGGCSEVNPAIVSDIGGETITVDSTVNVLCASNCNGEAFITNTCVSPPCNLIWLDSNATHIPALDNQVNATGLCAGQYFAQVTNAAGCVTIDSVNIDAPNQLLANDSVVDLTCFGDLSGQIFTAASGGTGAYTYAWSTTATSSAILLLAAGDYTLTLSDANACDSVFTITVDEPADITINATTSTDVSCFGLTDGTLSANASGGTAPLTYTWVEDVTLVVVGTGSNLANVGGGTYFVSVTDGNGCNRQSGTVDVTVPGQIDLSTTVTPISCDGVLDGQVDVVVNSGGTSPFTYAWSNGQNGTSSINLGGGTYTVTVTDGQGCTETAQETLVPPTALSATITTSDLTCAGQNNGSATAVVTGGTTAYTYLWSTGATTAAITGQPAGAYALTITDNNGCTLVEDPINIITPQAIVPNATVVHETCAGDADGSVTLAATGGIAPLTYAWSTGSAASAIMGLTPGDYTVTVSDANLCDSVETYTINGNAAITGAMATNDATCGGSDGDATVTPGGGAGAPYTITWFDNTFTALGQTGATATGLAAGVYNAIIQDVSLVCQDTVPATINNIGAEIIDVQDSTAVTCFGNTDGEISAGVSVTTDPPLTFEWFNLGTGLSVSGPISNITHDTVTGLPADVYYVQITNAAGCVTTEQIEVTSPSQIFANGTVSDPNCNASMDGSISVAASGGNGPAYQYIWSTGSAAATINGLNGGTYTVTITETGVNACQTDTTITLTAPPAFNTAFTKTDVDCFGDTDGSAAVIATGGQGVLTYSWHNGFGAGGGAIGTLTTISSLAAGNYSLLIADGTAFCDTTIDFTIVSPTLLVVDSVTATANPCSGDCVGTIEAGGSGGTAPYTYLWSPNAANQTTATATGLCAGTYTVTVTDNNACEGTRELVMGEGDAITLTQGQVDETCAGDADGSAGVNVSAGNAPFTYLWSANAFSSTNDTIFNLVPDDYTITVTDNNGCDSVIVFTILGNSVLTASGTTVALNCNGDTDGIATVTATGGSPQYTYLWDAAAANQTTATATGLSAGSYAVTITDANNCTWDSTLSITEPAAMTAGVTVNEATCLLSPCDGDGTVVPSGGQSPYTYLWDDPLPQTTAFATGLCSGNYTILVTDNNGCTETFPASISNINGEIITQNSVTDVDCFGNCNGAADIDTTCSTGPCSLQWLDIANDTIVGLAEDLTPSGLCAGTYYAQLENGVGCITRDTIVISEPDTIKPNETITNVTCNGDTDGSIVTAAVGGSPPLTYLWSNTSTASAIAFQPAGTYTLTISDVNACDSIFTFVIDEPALLQVDNIGATTITCFGDDDATATIAASGGNAPLTYNWFSCSSGALIGSGTTITNLGADQYRAVVTDATGSCSVTSICVTVPAVTEISYTTDSTDVSCFGDTDGQAEVTPAGGTGVFTYLWDVAAGSQITATAFNLGVGSYDVTVTDGNGCDTTATVDVDGPNGFTLNTAVTDVACFGDNTGDATANLTGGSTPYTYLWDVAAASQTTQQATGLSNGSYNLTITDVNGCDTVTSATVNAPAQLDPVVTVVAEDCAGADDGSATIGLTGGIAPYTYLWSDFQTTQSATGLAPGVYTATVTDNNGCDTIVNATIGGLADVVITPTVEDATCGICDGTIKVTATGGLAPYGYDWRDQTFGILPVFGDSIGNRCPGVYNVIVSSLSNSGGACFDTLAITVNNVGAEVIDSTTVTPVSCFGDCDGVMTSFVSYPLVDGPVTYQWFDQATGLPLLTTDTFASGLCAGIYNVQVTNNSGCITIATDTIATPDALDANEVITNVSCFGDATGGITVTPSGGSGMPYTYNWSTGGSNSSISLVVAGAYDVTIADPSGCDTIYSFTIVQPTDLTAITDTVDVDCNGDCNGEAIVTPAGGTAPYTYVWDDPLAQTDSNATGLCPNTYNATITDNNGCVLIPAGIQVTEPGALLASITASADVTCFGQADGSATVTPTGGTGAYTYDWTDAFGTSIGQTTATATGLSAGAYTANVLDANSCQIAVGVTLGEPTEIVLALDSTDASCFGVCDGAANVVATGGTSPYTYGWDDGNAQSTATATALCPDTYSVQVEDANGCVVNSRDIDVIDPPAITGVTGFITANCLQSDGSAWVTPAGGNPAFSYLWDDALAQTDSMATGLAAGVYNVTVTDASACTDAFSVTVPNAGGPIVDSIVITQVLCHGDSTGAIDLFVSGVNGPFLYAWSNGSIAEDLTTLPADTFYVSVTDQQGCLTLDTAIITQPDSIVVDYTVALATCNVCNGTVDAEVTGGVMPYNYDWYNAGSGTAIGQTDTMSTALCIGSYYVEITDGNGCVIDAQDTSVASPTDLTFLLDSISPMCNGDANGAGIVDILTGVAPFSITWDDGQTTDTATGLIAGTYFVTISDFNCVYDTSISISEPDAITETRVITEANCQQSDGIAAITAAGGTAPYSYLWDGNAGNQTTATATGLAAGTYNLTITDDSSCVEVFAIGVGNIDGPMVDSVQVTDILCNGDSTGAINLFTSGNNQPFLYAWTNGAVSEDLSNIPADTYTVTITDQQGCITFDTSMVTEPNAIAVAYTTTESTCGQANGSVDAAVTGGSTPYLYEWFNGTTGITTGQTTPTAIGLGPDSYYVVITDGNACVFTAPDTTVTTPDSLTFVLDSVAVACNGDSTGMGIVNITNGVLPFSITWDVNAGSQTTDTAFNLPAGTYCVTISDANCIVDTCISISEPDAIVATTTAVDISCSDICDGTVDAAPSGGTGALTYSWSTGATDSLITGLCGGFYTVTITDAVGCFAIFTDSVVAPDTLLPAVAVTDVLCFGDSTGNALASATGGTAPYTYAWNTGANSAIIGTLPAGNYTVTITDNMGCDSTMMVMVAEPTAMSDSIVETPSTCTQADGALEAFISGGVAPYTYNWLNSTNVAIGQTTSLATGLSAGVYKVEITDGNLCVDTFTTVLNDLGAETVSADSTDVSCYGACDGEVLATYSCNEPTCTLEWYESAGGTLIGTTDQMVGMCADDYYAQVTNNLGCVSTDLVTVIEPDPIQTNDSVVPVSCNGFSDGEVYLFPSGGNGGVFTYLWDGGSTEDSLIGLAPGTYTVTITNGGPPACDTTYEFTFIDPPVLSATTDSMDVACFGDCNGAAIATPTGGVAPYNYLWDATANNQIDSMATGLCPGSYNVTITDDAGCSHVPTAVDVTEPAQLTATISNASGVLCAGQCTGTGTVTPGGGTAPYAYLWDAAAGNQTDSTAVGLCAGTYSVVITDGGGCTAIDSVVITSPLAIAATFTSTPVSCNSGCDGQSIVTPTGGTAPYNFLWGNAAGTTDSTVTGLCSGIYNVSITDNNGCLAIFNTSISEPTAITGVVDTTEANCQMADGSAVVTPAGGTAPYTYLWSSGDTDSTATALFAGIYTVTVSDASGCSVAIPATLSNIAGPAVVLDSLNDASCVNFSDGEIYISTTGGTAPYDYQWLSGETTEDIQGLSTALYVVSVMDVPGCITFEDFFVDEPDSIDATLNVADASCGECNGQAEVIATGGNGSPYNYLWSNNSTAAIAGALCAGVYSVDVFDNNGCMQSFTNIGVSDIGGPTGDSITVSPTSCFNTCDGSINIENVVGGTTPYTYTWVPGGQSTTTLSNVCAGLYTVEIEDSLGCSLFSTVEVTSPPQITDSVTILATECGQANGSLILYPNNGGIPYSFAWSNATNQIDDAFSTRDTALAAGAYVITVTGASGCSEVFSYTVNASDAPVISTIIIPATCYGAADGVVQADATGGMGAFTWNWTDLAGNVIPQVGSVATGLAAGEYVVQVTDDVPCSAFQIVTVDEPDSLIFTSPTLWDASCANLCDAEAAVILTGGILPYTFQWEPAAGGQTTQLATGLCAGTFNVSVSDNNGCVGTDSVTVVEPLPVVITEDSVQVATCAVVNDGYIEISVAGGNVPYTYNWSGPNGYTSDSADVHNLFPGEYLVTVSDSNGCFSLDTFAVDTQVVIIANAGLDTVLCVLADSLMLVGTEESGNTQVNFQWETLAGDTIATGDSIMLPLEFPMLDSVIVLRVFDGACYNTDTVVVSTVGEPEADAGLDASIIAGTEISVGPTGGFNSSYTFTWTPNISMSDTSARNPTVAPLESITYYLEVSDQYGCAGLDSIVIEILPDVDFPTGFSPNGDGMNDAWVIDFINAYPEARVEVYNRWGQILFSSAPGYPDPWDGTFNGADVPVGTYYYIIDLNEPDAPEPITGPITIIR